ncbi:hypothetical protein DBV15_07386 [Temnothorax longispinosus]|uniref:Uncharacterized protein n=1 Tax=Temnothorax longispinosus TaxID=300112 RepID=A0A4S2KYL3_9HYME|nr:hypothetical protein DBV15_07386 [Temnothorax longispinosus]
MVRYQNEVSACARAITANRCFSRSGISPTPVLGSTERRCIVNELVGQNLRSQLSSCQKIFQTDVRPQLQRSSCPDGQVVYVKLSPTQFPIALTCTLISRESSPTRRKELAGAAECNGREAEEEREETEREYESGQELLRQRVYEVPEDRMPSERGQGVHVARFRKEKSVILLCVTGITRNDAIAIGSSPPASTQRLLCHDGMIDVIFLKNGTVVNDRKGRKNGPRSQKMSPKLSRRMQKQRSLSRECLYGDLSSTKSEPPPRLAYIPRVMAAAVSYNRTKSPYGNKHRFRG